MNRAMEGMGGRVIQRYRIYQRSARLSLRLTRA